MHLPELTFPFDNEYILLNKNKLKRRLKDSKDDFIDIRIAILSGSTIGDIQSILELFLLNYGIKPAFYVGDYNRFYEDIMYENELLKSFNPDIIYIHTSNRNILNEPATIDSPVVINEKLNLEFNRYKDIWDKINSIYKCAIIQNNFEMPLVRLFGNRDVYDENGKTSFIHKLNSMFYEYASNTMNFYINDINYLSAVYGLEKWANISSWYLYKYCLNVKAIPLLAHNIAKIIKSIYGKNQKCLALDLDNTLWGGVVGDSGPEGIEIGMETATGEAFIDFQKYVKGLQSIGVVLSVCSKNEEDIAIKAFSNSNMILKPEDFKSFKANWINKDENLKTIAKEINILPESIVFVDDNQAEQDLIRISLPEVKVLSVSNVEEFINRINGAGFFEVTNKTAEDINRANYYKSDEKRMEESKNFENYLDFLKSLEMEAFISPFMNPYLERITQLINKTNQFNLTNNRYSINEIEQISKNDNFITICGRLEDKYGSNGLVTTLIGEKDQKTLHVRLWTMSCRVFKRDLEYAVFDYLVGICKENKIDKIIGYYYKTEKNSYVAGLYEKLGFEKVDQNLDDSIWQYSIPYSYTNKNNVIKIIGGIENEHYSKIAKNI